VRDGVVATFVRRRFFHRSLVNEVNRDLGTRYRTALRVGDCAENASIHCLRQRRRRLKAARQTKHDKIQRKSIVLTIASSFEKSRKSQPYDSPNVFLLKLSRPICGMIKRIASGKQRTQSPRSSRRGRTTTPSDPRPFQLRHAKQLNCALHRYLFPRREEKMRAPNHAAEPYGRLIWVVCVTRPSFGGSDTATRFKPRLHSEMASVSSCCNT